MRRNTISMRNLGLRDVCQDNISELRDEVIDPVQPNEINIRAAQMLKLGASS